jgi:hypothetical protein
MKIFSLPNFATQSPRNASLGHGDDLRGEYRAADDAKRESRKRLRRRRFLQSRLSPMSIARACLASMIAHAA